MKSQSSEQRGYVIIMLVIVFGVVFTMGAAGVDLAVLYRWRIRLNRATDAAIQAGLDARLRVGWQRMYSDPSESTRPLFSGGRITSPPPTVSSAYRQLRAEVTRALRENLKAQLAAHDENASTLVDDELSIQDANIVWDPITDLISVSAEYRAPSSFFGNLGRIGFSTDSIRCGTDGRCGLRVTRRASLARASVAVVVDSSGSMICPIDGDCSCRFTNTCGVSAGGTSGRKLDFMIDALMEFSRYFNPNRDSIGVVGYRLVANVVSSPTMVTTVGPYAGKTIPRPFGSKSENATLKDGLPIATEEGYDEFEAAIRAMTASSNTNQCDGLVTAVQMLTDVRNAYMNLSVISGLSFRPFLVLFGDGAGTAFRGEFTQMETDGRYDTDLGQDMVQYEIQYSTDPVKPLETGFFSPSMLVNRLGAIRTGMYNFSFMEIDPRTNKRVPVAVPTDNVTQNETCGDVWADPQMVDLALDATASASRTLPAGKRRGCLKGLEFRLPLDGHTPVAADVATDGGLHAATFYNYFSTQTIDPTNPPKFSGGTDVAPPPGTKTMAVSKMRELYYYCSIEAADYARRVLQAPVFTIGVGAPAPLCSDPLQDPLEDNYRKDIFLGRLSADPSTISNDGSWRVDLDTGIDFRFTPRRAITLSEPDSQPPPETQRGVVVSRPRCSEYHRSWLRMGAAGLSTMVGYTPRDGDPRNPPEDSSLWGAYFAARDYRQISLMFVQTAKSILGRLDSTSGDGAR